MNSNFPLIFLNFFLLNALIASFLTSIASGMMGTYVTTKKISSLSGSIAHSILGGIGFVIWLNYKLDIFIDPIYGAFFAAILSALVIGYIHINHKQKEDAAIASVWSFGMGIGIIFVSLTPSFNADFNHFLFGNILLVSSGNLIMLLILDIFLLTIVTLYYNRFMSLCFNEELSFLQNINVKKLYLLLLCLISISIVLLIQIIGIILVIALLTIPPTIAKSFTAKMYLIMIISAGLSFFFNLSGLSLAYYLDIPPGATIASVAAICYMFFLKLGKKTCLR